MQYVGSPHINTKLSHECVMFYKKSSKIKKIIHHNVYQSPGQCKLVDDKAWQHLSWACLGMKENHLHLPDILNDKTYKRYLKGQQMCYTKVYKKKKKRTYWYKIFCQT